MAVFIPPQHDSSVYRIHAFSASGVLRPTSVRHYKIPLVLGLLLHPHPLEPNVQLRGPVVIVELGSSVSGDGVI